MKFGLKVGALTLFLCLSYLGVWFLVDKKNKVELIDVGFEPTVEILFVEVESSQPSFKELLIGVLSSPENFMQRSNIRQGWAKYSPENRFTYYFLIGKTNDTGLNERVARESDEYKDIWSCASCNEGYRNVSQKTLGFFTWAANNVGDSDVKFKWLLKTDDDSFVFIDRLLSRLEVLPLERLYYGNNRGMYIPQRYGKYAVTEEEYNNIGPQFACGAGYVLSLDVVEYVARVVQIPGFHPFPLEDVGTAIILSQGGYGITHDHYIQCSGGLKAAGPFTVIAHHV